MKSQIKNYLSITKKEWNGMVVMVVLIALILAAPYIYQLLHKDTVINFKHFNEAVAVLDKAKKLQADDYPDNAAQQTGKQVIAYKKAAPGVVIDVNTADSAMLTEVRGIGPSFARRIISYRQRLGGFYQKEQLKEVFGLDSAMFAEISPLIKVDASHISKVNINTVTFDKLSRFPYLSYKQSNAVIRFREEHGDFESIADLRNIAILNDETLNKIKPYIKFK